MKRSSQKSQERGMALLVAMFTLVLLSVIGLGLMYSTNMETIINANYRDKQLAMYGALSGLQEARDRLQPAAPEMPLPTAHADADEPSGDLHHQSDRWRDGCSMGQHQQVHGYGTVPGRHSRPDAHSRHSLHDASDGSDWYTVIDNSDDCQRTVESGDSDGYKVDSSHAEGEQHDPGSREREPRTSTQTCWDGAHQILRPAGYGPDCGPDGSIVRVTVTSGGTGYTSAPTVTIRQRRRPEVRTATGTATIAPLCRQGSSRRSPSIPQGQVIRLPLVVIIVAAAPERRRRAYCSSRFAGDLCNV